MRLSWREQYVLQESKAVFWSLQCSIQQVLLALQRTHWLQRCYLPHHESQGPGARGQVDVCEQQCVTMSMCVCIWEDLELKHGGKDRTLA